MMAANLNRVRAKWMEGAAYVKLDWVARRTLVLVAVWLTIVNIYALIAFNRLNLAPDNAFEWMSSGTVAPVQQSWDIIQLHDRWDSYWYLSIAREGYDLRGKDDISNVVFFPLYPMMIRLAGPLAGGNLVLAGWMISCVFLVLAVFMLTRVTQEFHPDIDPVLPAIFLLAHPAAFFLNAIYTESLFLFLSLSTVFCALRRKFLLASIWAALASATRVAGLFLCVLLFVEFLQANGWRALFTRRVWVLALAPLGILSFFLYHWIVFGDFFLFLKVQNSFGRDFSMEVSDFWARNNPDLANTLLDIFHAAAAILLAIVALVRLRLSYGVYMLISLGIALSSGTVLGIARYGLVLFPIFLIGAGLRSVIGRCAWLFGSVLLLALDIIRFVNHYWTS
jgi:Mannosyltransferase (PIG-V)